MSCAVNLNIFRIKKKLSFYSRLPYRFSPVVYFWTHSLKKQKTNEKKKKPDIALKKSILIIWQQRELCDPLTSGLIPVIVQELKRADCGELQSAVSMSQVAAHDWIRADSNSNKCQVCHKRIKTLAGRHCVWCKEMVRAVFVSADIYHFALERFWWVFLLKRHNECLFFGLSSCDCGPLRDHILPSWAIYTVSKVNW